MHDVQFVQYASGGSAIYADCNTGAADSIQGGHQILISILSQPYNGSGSLFATHHRLFPALYSICPAPHLCHTLHFSFATQPKPTLIEEHVQSDHGFYVVDQPDLQKRRRPMDCRCCNDWSSSEIQLTVNRRIRPHP